MIIIIPVAAESPAAVGPPDQGDAAHPELSQLVIIGVIFVAVIVVALNISLISCYLKWRRRPRGQKACKYWSRDRKSVV